MLRSLRAVFVSLSLVAHLDAQTLGGFASQAPFNEQVFTFVFFPNVRIHINAPCSIDAAKPTNLIFYALPNGNTIEQTIGKQMAEGVDWHFNIQHIGAQTRRLREIIKDQNIIVVYLEAEGKSFPQWRKKFANSSELIKQIVDTVRTIFKSYNPSVTLSGHSGGGSFVFGFINAVDAIPSYMDRITFLDSNYGYDDKERHGDKLIEWLQASDKHFLSVVAYDDRFITLNGKRVVSDSGGTFRATHRMIARFERDVPLDVEKAGAIEHYSGLNGRMDIRIHTNPDTLILHTVLVEKNGFIHAVTSGTAYEDSVGVFWSEPSYKHWITK